MKSLIFFLVSFVLISCIKENKPLYVDESEIPTWLKNKIKNEQILLKSDTKLLISFTAWIRYEWNGEFYFEHIEMFKSTFNFPISFDQDTLRVCPECKGSEYAENKCCKKFVWKGEDYIDK